MSRTRIASISLALALAMVSLASKAHADAISINFDSGPFVVTGTAGVAPFGNWNDLTTVDTTTPNLLDSTGANSGASITTSHLEAIFPFGGYTNDGANGSMLDSGAYNNADNSGSTKINMTGIPYAKYDVYIYSNPNAAGRLSEFTIGATTIPLTTVAVSGGPSFVSGGNYIEFTGLTGANFSVFTQAITSIQSSVSGLQVVDATPEPASCLLLGLGAAAMFGVARRRVAGKRA